MNQLYVWNNANLISLKGLPLFFFNKNIPVTKQYYVPLIRNRSTTFDYDDANLIVNTIRQHQHEKSVHVIVLSSHDFCRAVNKDILFYICSILIEQVMPYPNAHLLFLGFFPLPLTFHKELVPTTRFQNKLKLFIKNKPIATFKTHKVVPDTTLRKSLDERQLCQSQFFQEIVTVLNQVTQSKLSNFHQTGKTSRK